jgi:outer membrane PBP1 activator LpoA protein
MTGGFLPALIFQNVVTLVCEEKRLELAEEFIQKYSSELPPTERESARALALAKLSIAQKNYEKALSLLDQIEENSVAENLQCRLCKVRVLYELDKTEDLLKTLDNLAQYARRQRLKSVRLSDITGFVKVVKSLLQKEQKSKVQAFFHQLANPPLKAWVLEKIEQLP